MKTIIIAIIVCLIIFLISCYVSKNPKWMSSNYIKAQFIDSPNEIYKKSNGTFDEAAELALQRAKTRNSTNDNLLSATIITRNILTHEHKPEFDKNGNPTQNSLEVSQARRNLFDDAKNNYITVLQDNDIKFRNNVNNILNDVLGFAFEGLAMLITNDPLIHNFINLNENVVDETLINLANNRRTEVINERKNIAHIKTIEEKESKNSEIKRYLELSTQNTNDLQNSHDTGVLSCLKSVIDRLRDEQKKMILPSLDEIIYEFKNNSAIFSENRLYKVKDVIDVIDRTRLGEKVISIGANDEECLRRVWLRSFHPNNDEMKIKQSIFDVLYDCWEDGLFERKIVCVNGRTSRILSSLILLDFDTRNWEVKRLEQLKNDIYQKTAIVIEEEAKNALSSDDILYQNAGKLYLSKTEEEFKNIGETSDEITEKLSKKMKESIEKMIRTFFKENSIPEYMIKTIIEEAQAAC